MYLTGPGTMTSRQLSQKHTIDDISRQIGHRAGNLFVTRQLWCSGAVLVVLNRALGGDLPQELAIRLAAGLGKGLGGGGCICGGLSAGALALGIFLGNGHLAPSGDETVLTATRQLHDQFKSAHGSTCCRVLVRQTSGNAKPDYRQCALRTAKAAEIAATLIMNQRPELIRHADWDYLNQNESRLGARLKIAADRLKAR